MDALYVSVEPLRHLLPPAPARVGFLDLQALLGLGFYDTQKALFVLRDAGLVDRFPRGLGRPEYSLTHVAERALALGAARAKAPITGNVVDAVTKIVADVNLSLASLTVRHGGGAAMTITLSIGAGRHEDLEDRVRRLVERLEKQAALPPLRLALVQEAPAAGGGG